MIIIAKNESCFVLQQTNFPTKWDATQESDFLDFFRAAFKVHGRQKKDCVSKLSDKGN